MLTVYFNFINLVSETYHAGLDIIYTLYIKTGKMLNYRAFTKSLFFPLRLICLSSLHAYAYVIKEYNVLISTK